MIFIVKEKQCKICKETKPLDEYYSIDQTNSKGEEYTYFFPYCKKCNIEKAKNSNFDKELHNELCRQWRNRPENRVLINKHATKHRAKGGALKWQRNNKDKIREYQQARAMEKSHKITDKEWASCKEYFNFSCAYCGIGEEDAKEKYDNYLHKDHVVHDGENDLSNCVPACKSCNSSKHNFELNYWFKERSEHYSESRLHKIYNWLNSDYKQYTEEEFAI